MRTRGKIFHLCWIQVENERDEKNRSISNCWLFANNPFPSNNSVIIFIDTVRERKRHVLEEMAGYSNRVSPMKFPVSHTWIRKERRFNVYVFIFGQKSSRVFS